MAKYNRKGAEAYLYAIMDKMDDSGRNTTNLRNIFSKMPDDKFLAIMQAIRERKHFLPFILDNLSSPKINLRFINRFATKELKIQLRQRVRYRNPETGEYYWSNTARWVLDIPVRRLIQSIENKMSVSTSKQVNAATNQPVGDNKAVSISAPESLILDGQGFRNTVTELMVVRGGDMSAKHAMEQSIRQSGGASLNTALAYGEGAKAVRTVSHQLTAMHWRNNLADKS